MDDQQLLRYSRHLLLDEIGIEGQEKLLAAHALGLGAVWTAGYPGMERVKPIAEALGIPEKVIPLCVIPVGVPAESPAPKDKWKPENIHWNQW